MYKRDSFLCLYVLKFYVKSGASIILEDEIRNRLVRNKP